MSLNTDYDITHMPSYRFSDEVKSLMIPVASIEILGREGPLGADYLVAQKIVPLVAERTCIHYTPTVPFGDTQQLPTGGGTVHIPSEILSQYYGSIARSYKNHSSIRHLFFFTFHSLNLFAVDLSARDLSEKQFRISSIDWWKCVSSVAGNLLDDKKYGTGHGGEMIMSVMSYLFPEYIDIHNRGDRRLKEGFDYYVSHLPRSASAVQTYGDFSDYCEDSCWGSLDGVSEEKGKLLVERAVETISEQIVTALQVL
ncbi:MAG: creatininase family protein [Sphaerochaetaceae bacterium]|nr:creatininase family protein [Sphaerochaetaceae bacterium]